MGGDGPSILGPAVYFTTSYQHIRCPPEELNLQVIEKFARKLVKNDLLPVQCSNAERNQEIAVGIVLVATGYPTEAYNHFNKIVQEDISCPAVYYGRALAYAKSGLSRQENAVNALNDFNNALKYVKSEEQALSILERRAEVYQAMSRLHDANADYSRILKNNKSDPNIYMHRGSVLFLLEEYSKANEDFKKSLEVTPDQPVAMHYQALCLYNMGKLRDAVKLFQDILRLKPDYTEIIQSLGQAYQELGEFDLAIENFNKALSVNPTDARSYHYKGLLQYQRGDSLDAMKSFKKCTSLEPFNEQCQFMKGASLATVGEYYPAVKEFTKVMLSHPTNPTNPSSEHKRVIYLREWCRYMHSQLPSSLSDVSAETDLPPAFREHWVNSHPFDFSFQNYTEQPGIQPHIKDVTMPVWDNLPVEKQKLICKAYHMGSRMQGNNAESYLGNRRLRTAMGLAAIEISQAIKTHFKSTKKLKSKNGKKNTWRSPFDIAVKWKRLVDANRPIMWLDQLPNSKSKPNDFVHHINLMKGDKYNLHYMKYTDEVVALIKKLVLEFTNTLITDEYRSELEKAKDYESLIKTITKHGGAQAGDPGFALGTKVLSVKDRKRKHLDGFMVSLSPSEQNNSSVLTIDITSKRARTQQYHAELDFIWEKFAENMTKLASSKQENANIKDSLIDSTLSLAYYFYNLMPISEGSGVISYATTIGLLLAAGKEVKGQMDSGKMMEMDALLASSPEDFVEQTKIWMKISKTGRALKEELPDVTDILPTLRSCIEAVNIGCAEYCT